MKHFKTLFFVSIALLLSMQLSAQNFINHRGQDLFLSGINVAWMSYGNDLTGFDEQEWTTICEEVSNAGGNSLRWWIHVDGRSTPTYDVETKLVTGMPEAALNNLSTALDIAAEHGLVVSLCLWSHAMLVYNDSGDQSTATGTARIAKNEKLFTDTTALQAYIDNALIPMVEKVKNHTAILCWEIFNEPEGMTDLANWSTTKHVEMSQVQRFVNRCAGAIHRTDPNVKVSNGNWTVLSTAEYKDGHNYYTDSALVAEGGDKDGILDFYMFHYYPGEKGQAYSPFHKTYEYFAGYGVDKNLIIGEFPAHGIIKTQGATWLLPQNAQKNTTKSMLWLYDNGYSGGWGWTYTNHDGNGGLDDMREAMDTLKKLHPEHIIVQHDEDFNYKPYTVGTIPDTALFTNSPEITNYINVFDYFADDANDSLTYLVTFDGSVLDIVTHPETGYIDIKPVTTQSEYTTVNVVAKDKGGKEAKLSFNILVRDTIFTADNKLLNAFVLASSIEEDSYKHYYVNDGVDSTRWSSLYTDDQYLLFDMFQEESIQRFVLNWEWTGEKGAYAEAYNIAVSTDKVNWDTVFSVSKGQTIQSNIILDEPVTCRYVKITFTERATIWGYSLSEVQAYSEKNENHPVKVVSKTQIYQAGYANELYQYQKNLRTLFSDEDNDVLTISLKDAPAWLQFDPEKLTISGTPQPADTGVFIFSIVATDYAGETATKSFKAKIFPAQTSINEIESIVSIFPNPCNKDSFTITIPNVDGKALVSCTNAEGKLAAIKYLQFAGGSATCLTDGLTTGTYILTIRVNSQTYKTKVIIK